MPASKRVVEAVEQILREYRKGGFSEEDWGAIAPVVEIVPPVPNLPKPLFVPCMRLAVPSGIELVFVRDGKVFLVKRDFFGDVAHHTPGSYIAPGETMLEAAQRCARREAAVSVLSFRQISPMINHPDHPRFHDATVLLLCDFEGEPQAEGGGWFGRADFPTMLRVQEEYRKHIEPYLL